jgi:ABC-type nitrate/sulfonate/bicarbonate transport system substrate-binding protein
MNLRLVVAFCVLFGLPAGAQTLTQIKVTTPIVGVVFLPLYHAQEAGYFKRAGLEVEALSTNGDGPDVDALIAGSVQFTLSTPNRLFTAYQQGRKLLAVMSLSDRMTIECFMNKTVADRLGDSVATPLGERLKSLKGLTVAGTRPGAFTYLMLQAYAKTAGLVAQKDLEIIGIGGPQAMVPALENGQVALACGGSPAPEIAVASGKAVMFTDNMGGADPEFDHFLFEMVYARPDTVKSDPQMVRAFLGALIASMHDVIATPSVQQLPALRKLFSGVSDEMMVSILDRTKPTWRQDGVVTEEQLDKAAKFLIDTGAVQSPAATFDQVVDNSLLPAH